MRNRYAIALTILGAYFIASYSILHAAIDQQRSMQRVVSVSGMQRMYSQRIAMFADAMSAEPSPGERRRARADLATSIRVFGEAHRALVDGDPKINPRGWPPASVRAIYFARADGVDRQVREYLRHARALEARANGRAIRNDDRDLEYLLSVGPGPFLRSLDGVVAAYNREQRESATKFEGLQIGLLVLGLSTLAAIWFTILMPMEHEIERRTAAMALTASQDSLTRALNREAFAARVETALERSRPHELGAMLMIDIDNFKTINDTFGHVVGDETIVRIAGIIRENARASDDIARFGGDEFAIFAPSFDGESALVAFVDRLCGALQFEFTIGERTHRVTASIGVARFPRDGTTLHGLLRAADDALYASKRSGRARRAFFSSDVSALPAHV